MRGERTWVGFEPPPDPAAVRSERMGHGGGGGRGLVGGWCPPPGPEKGRRSVWRGSRGPMSHGAESKNRGQSHFGGPPASSGPAPCLPWVPRESPFPRAAPEPVPASRCPAGPEIQPLLPFFGCPKVDPLRPLPSEPRVSMGAAPRGVGKPTTCSFVVLSTKTSDGTI